MLGDIRHQLLRLLSHQRDCWASKFLTLVCLGSLPSRKWIGAHFSIFTRTGHCLSLSLWPIWWKNMVSSFQWCPNFKRNFNLISLVTSDGDCFRLLYITFSFGELSVLFPLPVCLIFVWCGRLPFLFSLFWLVTPFYSFQLLGIRWLSETHFSPHYRSDPLLSGRMEDGLPASGGPQTQSMWMTFSSTSLPFSVLRAQSPALLSPGPVGLEAAASCGSRWWHDSFTQHVVYLSPPRQYRHSPWHGMST